MKKVTLGKTGLEIAPINLGGNVFGWTLDEAESFAILDAFADAGLNFIDTADTYSWWVDGNTGGESETIVGNWLARRGNRDQIVIATKVGSQNREHGIDVSKAYILKTVDESLKRLRTDYIDVYYTHFDNEQTPVEETLSAYEQLLKDGKIRHIGASNLSPARLKASLEASEKHSLPAYTILQPHYNLIHRGAFEQKYAPLAAQYDLAVLPYFALGAGFLTGKYRSEADLGKSQRGGGMKDLLTPQNLTILAALDEVAGKYDTVPAAIALAWLLHKPHVAAPVVSATSQRQLDTLVKATEISLDSDDLTLLDEVSAS